MSRGPWCRPALRSVLATVAVPLAVGPRAEGQVRPEIAWLDVHGGGLVLVSAPDEASVALSGGDLVHAVASEHEAPPLIVAHNPRTGEDGTVFDLPPRPGQSMEVTSILPFVNGEALVVSATLWDEAGQPAGHQVFLHDLTREVTELLLERPPDASAPRLDAFDWSLRNEILFYEHDPDDPKRWDGDGLRVVVYPRESESLTDRFAGSGWPTLSPGGRWLVTTTGPDDIEGIPYRLWVVDLETGERRRLFERFGTRVATFEGRIVMTPTPDVWTSQEDAVVFADSDHAAEMSPLLMRVPLSGRGIEERRLQTRGEALDVVPLGGEAFAALVRRLGDGAHVVEVLTFGDAGPRVVYVDSAGRARLMG